MKKPEEYIKYGVEGYPLRDIIDNITDDEILEMMVEMQKDAYNEALDDASNIHMTGQNYCNVTNKFHITKEAILKLKK